MKNEDTEKVNNAGNPLLLLFIFIVIIGFIFFIPEVYEKYNKDKASLYGIGSQNESTNSEKRENTNVSKISDHFRIEDSTKLNNLSFSNIKIDGNTLYIDINNMENKAVNLDEENYYIEFYKTENNQRTFINRRPLKSVSNLEQGKTTISVDITGITINQLVTFAILYITDDAMPAVKLTNDTLTCSKNNVVYIYSFDNDILIKTNYKITLNKDETTLNSYKEKVKQFNNLNGVDAKINENDANFVFDSTFDYKKISKYKVDINYLYEANTKASVISFKNSAEGFDCK